MKTITIFFMLIFSISQVFAGGLLKSGISVPVTLTSDINSESKEQPTFIITSDIKDRAGNILIAQGTPVVTEANIKKRKGVGKPGLIDLKFISTTAIDGQVIMLNGTKHVEGENLKSKALGVGLGVGLLLFPPMLAYMAKKGGSAQMSSGLVPAHITTVQEYVIQ